MVNHLGIVGNRSRTVVVSSNEASKRFEGSETGSTADAAVADVPRGIGDGGRGCAGSDEGLMAGG
jgi:hypothetical protein